jgi:hypothetical protein
MVQMEQSEGARIEQLEGLVSGLRHDIRGLITPASLIADRLRLSTDPAIQRSANMMTRVVERIVARLNATYEQVPPRDKGGPVIGAGGQRIVSRTPQR